MLSPGKQENQTLEASDGSTLPSIATTSESSDKKRRPRKLGRFEIVAVLGTGGFGKVYKARDPSLDRFVALKVPISASDGEHRIKRFVAEAKAAARLIHPNIVTTYESGRAGDNYYIATEYIEGELLSDRLKRGTLSFSEAADIVRKLAMALDYAHSCGIVHRDLKPHNVMLDGNGDPQLMDFGLARRTDEESHLTTDGSLLGTPAYMSPEQARGDVANVDALSDQYSLGVVLYHLLTGTVPHEGAPYVIVSKVAMGKHHRVRDRNPKVDPTLDAICQKAMMPERKRRYQSCEEFASDLLAWSESRPVLARPTTRLQALGHPFRRHKVAAGATLGVVAVFIAALMLVAADDQPVADSSTTATRDTAVPASPVPESDSIDSSTGAVITTENASNATTPTNFNHEPSSPDQDGLTAVRQDSLVEYLEDDLEECLISGTAFMTAAGQLRVGDQSSFQSLIEIPVILPDEYELEIVVRRETGGGSFLLCLPHQGFPVGVVIDGAYGSGITAIDGQGYRDNLTNVRVRQFVDRQEHTVQVVSSADGFFVNWDGRRLAEFTGPAEQLSLGGNEHPNLLLPALKTVHYGGFLIERATIRTDGVSAAYASDDRIKLTKAEKEVAKWARGAGGSAFFDKGLQIELPPDATISDRDFRRFKDLPHLTSLIVSNGETNFKIAGVALSDDAILQLNSLPNLRSIAVGGQEITDRGLAHLAAFPIEDLIVFHASITSQGLNHFKSHKLQTLVLNDCKQMDGTGFEAAVVSHTNTLRLSGTPVTNRFFDELGTVPSLRNLSIDDTRMTPAIFEQIANHKSLELLDLSNIAMEGEDLKPLLSLTSIKYLGLRQTRVSAKGLQLIADSFPTLEQLDATGQQIEAGSEIDWTGLQRLNRLWLYGTAIQDKQLVALAEMSDLQFLGIDGLGSTGTHFSIDAIQAFARKLPQCYINGATAQAHAKNMVGLAYQNEDTREESLLDYLPDDLSECLIRGTVSRNESAELVMRDPNQGFRKEPFIEIPVDLPDEYELRLSVRQELYPGQGAFIVNVPHRNSAVSVILNGISGSGLSRINGASFPMNSTSLDREVFSDDQSHLIRILSSDNGLFVDFDGARLFEFTGPPTALGPDLWSVHRNLRGPAFKVAHGGRFIIEKAIVQSRGVNVATPSLTRAELSLAKWVRDIGGQTAYDRGLLQISIPPSATISDIDFHRFQDLPHLSSLIISNGKPDDTIQGTALSDDAILHLKSLPRLNKIAVSGTAITNRGLQHLAKFPIDDLTVFRASITSLGLGNFRNHKLKTLAMNYCAQVSDKDFDQQIISNVEGLNLLGTSVSDDFIDKLNGIESLKQLNVSDTRMTAKALDQIGAHRSLEALGIDGITIVDGDLERLSDLRNLSDFSAARCNITERGVQFITNAFPLIEKLDVSGNRINPDSSMDWSGMQQLTFLRLYGTPINDRRLLEIAEIPNLSYLGIDDPEAKVSVKAMQTLARKLPRCGIFKLPTSELISKNAKFHAENMRRLAEQE